MAQKLPRQAAALLQNFAGLTDEEQLLAYEAITEYLGAGETRLVVDPEIEERAEALRVMRAVVEHLGRDDASKLLVREFNEAPEKVREEWKSGRVIRAWGTWVLARQALSGARKTETARQRSLRSVYGSTKLSTDDYLAGVRAWLATDPPKVTQLAYMDWRKEWNNTRPEGALPYPVPASIRQGLNLTWRTTVEVARGEITVEDARKDEFRHTRSINTGEHHFVTRMDIAQIADKNPGVTDVMTHAHDFPTPVLVKGKRRLWLLEDVEAYLAGSAVPEREVNELGHLYMNSQEVAELLGRDRTSINRSRLSDIPEPVFRSHADRLWRRRDAEAFKKEHDRRKARRGK
jgi:hypothetical protein